MKAKHSVMGVAAHCDDVEFLFGGILLKYHDVFDYEVVYVQSTNNMSGEWTVTNGFPPLPEGDYKRELCPRPNAAYHVYHVPYFIEMPQRKKESQTVAEKFFGTDAVFLDYPQRHYFDKDLRKIELCYGAPRPDCVPENMPSIMTAHDHPEEVEKVASLILEKNPEVIITHAPVDYTEEHTATSHLMRKAFLAAKKRGYDGSLIFAPPLTPRTYGELFERFDVFVDISGFEEKKRFMIGHHNTQVPYPERLDLEDLPRGAKCGVKAAELFYNFEISSSREGTLTDELRNNYEKVRSLF